MKKNKRPKAPFNKGDTVYFEKDILRMSPATVVECKPGHRYTRVTINEVTISYPTDWLSF